jgi:Ca2+-binding protein (EF-Hand superfamily)
MHPMRNKGPHSKISVLSLEKLEKTIWLAASLAALVASLYNILYSLCLKQTISKRRLHFFVVIQLSQHFFLYTHMTQNNNNNTNHPPECLFQGNLWTGMKQSKRQPPSQNDESIIAVIDESGNIGSKNKSNQSSTPDSHSNDNNDSGHNNNSDNQNSNNRKESSHTTTTTTTTTTIMPQRPSPKSSSTKKTTSSHQIRPRSSRSSSRPSVSPCKNGGGRKLHSSKESSSSLSPVRNRTTPRPFSSQQPQRRLWDKQGVDTSPKRGSDPTMPSRTSTNSPPNNTKNSNAVISPLKKSRPAPQVEVGKQVEEGTNTHDNKMKIVEQMKNDRRRKSVNVLRNSAQSDQIRQMFDISLYEDIASMAANHNVTTDGMAEERLNNILTKAKESGMTADEIFSFFNGGNPNTTKITKDSFLASLEKLGGSFMAMTEEELANIVKKFDMNDDGKISIAEFKNYCYFQIPSIAWKAERTRLEKSGEMKMLQAQLSRRFKLGECLDINACGEEVCRTSKFFWKTNNNVEIRMFYNEKLNVISMQLFSQAFERELPSIYVCKNKVDHQRTHLQDDVQNALQKTEGRTEEQEATRKHAMWDSIAKHLVERLKIWERGTPGDISSESEECSHISKDEQYVPYLCKLPGRLPIFITHIHVYIL